MIVMLFIGNPKHGYVFQFDFMCKKLCCLSFTVIHLRKLLNLIWICSLTMEYFSIIIWSQIFFLLLSYSYVWCQGNDYWVFYHSNIMKYGKREWSHISINVTWFILTYFRTGGRWMRAGIGFVSYQAARRPPCKYWEREEPLGALFYCYQIGQNH